MRFQRFNRTHRHGIVVRDHYFNLVRIRAGEPGVHFVFRLGGIPHSGIHLQLLGLQTFIVQLFDNVGGTRFRIRMARLAFQQDVLDLTVFIQIPVRVGFPVLGDQIALNNPGLFRVGTDVISLVITIQRFAGRLFVEEHHRNILPARLFNHRTCGGRVNQVNRQRLHAFRQQHVNLIVLFRLVVLRIIHQQLDVWRGFAIFFNRLTHYRHKVVVIFINRHADTGICCVCGGAK